MNSAQGALGLTNLSTVDFGKGEGLVPAIVQHTDTGSILMLGYMNREALEATLTRGRVVFFSRSKGRLWEKGESSGHTLFLTEVRADCDGDALLVLARPKGATCHLGALSCFGNDLFSQPQPLEILQRLEGVIVQRMVERPEGSYTASLFEGGIKRIAQKVGEEGLEVALAGIGGGEREVIDEFADLIFHLLVLLKARGLSLEHVMRELRARHVQSLEMRP